MGKINLHCHSTYSDGANTIEELALEHKKQGFDAMVITDHLYFSEYHVFINKELYEQQAREIALISKKLDYPIIQGLEVNIYHEEVLVFGNNLFNKILEFHKNESPRMDLQSNRGIIANKILECIISNRDDDSAIILCHPCLHCANVYKEFYNKLYHILDGYERFNSGQDWFKGREIPKELKDKKAYNNSDAHSVSMMELGHNISKEEIYNEIDLIKYIKN